jgi:L-amino acid N-acyltransferase YncA
LVDLWITFPGLGNHWISMATVRLATLSDLPRIVDIYNQAISAQNATADTVPFTVRQRMEWFQAHTPEAYPIYVYDETGQALGWLSVSPYRGRPALARTAEVSYYVDYGQHGRGIGSALMRRALADAPELSKMVYIAILLEWNIGSIHLLEKFGFEKWGYLPEVAEFNGRLCGQFYYGKKMQATQ